MKIALSRIAHTRSGDKGNKANVGVMAWKDHYYPILLREVTAGKVKSFFGDLVEGPVLRYEAPNMAAMNFELFDALDGGGTLSLRIDAQGKTLGAKLLELEIEVDPDELEA